MSRTYREIPDNGFRDKEERNWLWSSEEKKGRVHSTKTVRDKDNHGCAYSKPSDFKTRQKRRYRRNVNQQLKKLENECWDVPRDTGDEILLPKPKEYQPYYW